MRKLLLASAALAFIVFGDTRSDVRVIAQTNANTIVNPNTYQDLRWRSIGPTRGGRSTAAAGVRTQPNVFYMGATGGGVWKTENYGVSWFPVTDGQIPTGSIGAHRRRRLEPECRLRRHRQRSDPIERDCRTRRLQVHRRGEDVAVRGAQGSRADRPARSPSEESRHRLRRGDRPAVRLGTGPRRLPHQGRRQDLAEGAVHQRSDRRGLGRDQLAEPERALRRRVARTAQAVDDHQRRTGGGRRRLQDDRRRRSLVARQQRIPRRSDRQGVGGRRAVEPEGRLRAGRSEGRERRVSIARADGGSSWTHVNSSQSLRARPFYFNKVFVSPKDENDVWVSELNFHHSTDGGKTFVNVNTPHGDNHVVWFNPDNPHIFIETNDGGANITQDNGKSWSSINNQPTAEMYMVDADEQFPYNIYGPQQDTGKNLTVPSCRRPRGDPTIRSSSGCRRRDARAARCGRFPRARSSTATARASSAG